VLQFYKEVRQETFLFASRVNTQQLLLILSWLVSIA
jgi:hypothetical protein